MSDQLAEQLDLLPGYLTGHLQLTLLALLLATLISVPVGIWATRVPWLKQAAVGLSNFEASQIATGRPKDELLDVFMMALAEVYLAFRLEKDQIADVPHSPRSIFIRFCSEVLQHFFSPEAIDFGTLTQRWRRLKGSHRDPIWPLGS